MGGQIVFCNPPYSRKTKDSPGQEDWIEKCYKECEYNLVTSVMLIPARTDTKVQHNIIFPKAKYICFIRGRLKFGVNNSAPFPSELVIFTKQDYDKEIFKLNDLGYWIKLR